MIDEQTNQELNLYAQFVEEIKDRTSAIERSIDRVRPGAPPIVGGFVEIESCILQIRYICELIALAALTAHHRLGLSAKLLKSWNADETFARLAHLNPNCFPRAATIIRRNGELKIDLKQDQMTMAELQAIYAECGTLLHRGVLKHALADNRRNYNADKVVRWTSRVRNLLSQHVVMLLEAGNVLIVQMVSPKGEVEIWHSRAAGPSALFETPTERWPTI